MMRRYLALLLIIFGLFVSALALEKEVPLPKDLPPYGPLQTIPAPKVVEQKLANGLTLWLVPRPGFPKVAFAVAVRGGMAVDPKDRPGLSELLMATIDQGTKTRSAKQIAEEVQAAGGDLSGSADADAIVIGAVVLSSKAEAALGVIADVLQNATFADKEVALAKRNATDALAAREADPSFLARRALARVIFGDHPYSVIAPTKESIANSTPEELRREYARRFRPDQTLLVAVGDFQAPALTAAIQNNLGKWAAPSALPTPAAATPAQANRQAVFVVERPGSVQTTFAFAAFGPTGRDPDYAATQVANAIYGGMFGSRLVKNIREDKGYTYSPGGYLQARRATGVLQTRADVSNDVTGASFNEICYELNRMATTAPTEEEVIRAQRYLTGVRALSLQSGTSVGSQLASLWVRDLPSEELARQIDNILKAKPADVEAAGKKYFPAAREAVVAVGEEKVIQRQLEPFGVPVKPAP
jgi:zinc protease